MLMNFWKKKSVSNDNDFAHFINYEDATWSKDDYEWLKKEDGKDIKNDNHS
jgi:hypothetical protein